MGNYKRVLVFLFSLLQGIAVFSHSGKPAHHVIIDTDGALDDMRAITMLLSGNEIRVLAITCSQGTLAPDLIHKKVRSLLSAYHHEGIPVAVGDKVNSELPYWSGFAGAVPWGYKSGIVLEEYRKSNGTGGVRMKTEHIAPCGISHTLVGVGDARKKAEQSIRNADTLNTSTLLQKTVENYSDDITLVALGSLKTYADWLRSNPAMVEKIKRVIWYNSHLIEEGFNYQLSPGSYDFMVQSGINMEIVSSNRDQVSCNREYLDHISRSGSVYAQQINTVFSNDTVNERTQENPLWDDMAALYLAVPVLFTTESRGGVNYVSLNARMPVEFVYETITTLLNSSLVTNNRVFETFPVDRMLYRKDYAEILTSTMEKYGPEEWKAICLTNEIHGHTGIYSIIGAKMGIRAMEYFHVGINNLEAISFAGGRPPLSCLTDGVQISTGATPGQGLLTIAGETADLPTVEFTFNGRTIHMVLNESIATQMKEEIRYGVENFGLESDTYWLYIEKLAIEYWTGFNRHEIFSITEL
ncbi:MAG: nucleoside hydrolase [Bacteroidales bacterium]